MDSDKDATADSLRLAASQGNKRLVKDYMSRMAEATLVEQRILNMFLTQLELMCTNSTVHYILNEKDSKDPLLTSN